MRENAQKLFCQVWYISYNHYVANTIIMIFCIKSYESTMHIWSYNHYGGQLWWFSYRILRKHDATSKPCQWEHTPRGSLQPRHHWVKIRWQFEHFPPYWTEYLWQNKSDAIFKVREHCDEGHVPESNDEVKPSGKVNDGEIFEIIKIIKTSISRKCPKC